MSFKDGLMGTLDLDKERLVISVGNDILTSRKGLTDTYGKIGQGISQITANKHLAPRFDSIDWIVMHEDGVDGLGEMDEYERKVVEHLLSNQYKRSLKVYRSAQSGEIDEFDDVSWGVLKGVTLGAIVGVLCDLTGERNVVTEIVSRAGPGALEASGIANEVLKDKYGVTHEDLEGYEKFKFFWRELGEDIVSITKRTPTAAKSAVIGLADFLTLYRLGLEKLLTPSDVEDQRDSNTRAWAEAGEDAPYKGLIGITAVEAAKSYGITGPIVNAIDSVSTFWVNTGNNVQGALGVYNNMRERVRDAVTSKPAEYWQGLKAFAADPFQLANGIVAATFLGGQLLMRVGLGYAIEDQFGNIGAGMESAAMSCDTAVAAQFAKPIIYVQLVTAPWFETRRSNLVRLATHYEAHNLATEINIQRYCG